MVGHMPLKHVILVRIQVPQQIQKRFTLAVRRFCIYAVGELGFEHERGSGKSEAFPRGGNSPSPRGRLETEGF